MPVDFPSSPVNGQTFSDGDRTWEYSSSLPGWKLRTQTVVGAVGPVGAEGGTSILTSKGDLLSRTSTSVARVPIGSNNAALTADSTQTTGLTWANPRMAGGSARLLTNFGARLTGTGLFLSGTSQDWATVLDSPGLRVTGDIDIKVKVTMPDWTPPGSSTFISKYTGVGTYSYLLEILASGVLRFNYSVDGTAAIVVPTSPALGFADGSTRWVRCSVDVNDGAGNYVVKYYTSVDGSTWTTISTNTVAGPISFASTNAVLRLGTWGTGNGLLRATIHRAIIQAAYDTTDNETALVFDANPESVAADLVVFNARGDTGIKANGLVLAGRVNANAQSPDSPALSITGDIDFKVKVALTNWVPATRQAFVSKTSAGSGQYSYQFDMNTNGTIRLVWYPDGINALTVDSTVATGVPNGTSKWIRATMDANNGASQRVIKFYLSDDGSTWTQLGSTVTQAGATSIADSTSALQIGEERTFANLSGTIQRVIIQSGYDTTDNTTGLAFDADFDAQSPETTSFIESSPNAARVTINGCYPIVNVRSTRYGFGIPGVQFQSVGVTALSVGAQHYSPFIVSNPISVDMLMFEVTSSPTTSNAAFRAAIYAADGNFQPVGNPVVDFGVATVFTANLAAYYMSTTPTTLQPGAYLMVVRANDVGFTVRRYVGGSLFTNTGLGSSPYAVTYQLLNQTGPLGTAPRWNNRSNVSNVGQFHFAVIRWSPL